MTTERLVARMRGAFVGGTSGAVSIAAHALGGGGAPTQSAAVLLVAAALVSGVVAAGTRVPVVAVLTLGQLLGHAVLTLDSDHVHLPDPGMAVAHTVAVGVAALLVTGAERGCRRAVGALRRLAPRVLALPATRAPAVIPAPERSDLPATLATVAGPTVRGPPFSGSDHPTPPHPRAAARHACAGAESRAP